MNASIEIKGEEPVSNFANIMQQDKQNWFFQVTPDGRFTWNPDLIKAFVDQVRDEQQKQIEQMLINLKGDKKNE